ncbi:MAG: sulfatase/phosphatase domain-containing protein, partial [Planctomycetota bacterium]
LLPLLRDPNAPWREAIYYAYWFEPPYPTPTMHAVRTARHKYVEYEHWPPELFDLTSDPGERRNLLENRRRSGISDELRRTLAALRLQIERRP